MRHRSPTSEEIYNLPFFCAHMLIVSFSSSSLHLIILRTVAASVAWLAVVSSDLHWLSVGRHQQAAVPPSILKRTGQCMSSHPTTGRVPCASVTHIFGSKTRHCLFGINRIKREIIGQGVTVRTRMTTSGNLRRVLVHQKC